MKKNVPPPEEILAKKEKYYRRNYIALMFESFLFTFSSTFFSYKTVLPVYVANLTSMTALISLISILYYGCSYTATVASCVIGVNARSPKWISVGICLLQRFGFLLIYLSTFLVGGTNAAAALAVFFIAFGIYSASAGMGSPLFNQMVSVAIHRNVGNFYGSYAMVGSGSGILASLILAKCQAVYNFPKDYRVVFLIGLVVALIASAEIAIFLREVTDDRVVEKIHLRDILPISRDILKNNSGFRYFVIIRVIMSMAEFAVPYYIVRASGMKLTPASFVGIMSLVYMFSEMTSGKIYGWLSQKKSPIFVLRAACIAGISAALLALLMPNFRWGYVMDIFLAFAVNGAYLSTSVGSIMYSKAVRTPIYVATASVMCAPALILASLIGGLVVNTFSIEAVFIIAIAVYAVAGVLTVVFTKKLQSRESEAPDAAQEIAQNARREAE